MQNQNPQGSHRSFNLARAEAPAANMYRLVRAVYNSLYLPDIRLPHAVASPMRVADFDTEGYALATQIALCHFLHLLYVIASVL